MVGGTRPAGRRGLEGRQREVSGYRFRVYVAGQTERTQAAVANLRSVCEARLAGHAELEIIDAVERPDLAEADGIFIAPTVLRLAPWPPRRVYGDLSDHDRVVAALGLPEPSQEGER